MFSQKQFNLKPIFVSLVILAAAPVLAQSHSLVTGWNLEGNNAGFSIDPNVSFGNATAPIIGSPDIVTVWAWDKGANNWNFFAPSMTPTELASYAKSKNYGVMTGIAPGQGFWINAKKAVAVNLAGPSNSIVGTWYDGSNTNNSVITFFSNGDYMQAKAVTTNAGATAGIERGTYSWNATTGAFVPACPTAVDTNAADGFCNASSATTFTFTVNGDTINFQNSHAQAGTLSRVKDANNPLVGSWVIPVQVDGTGGTNVVFTFFSNGDYVMAQSVMGGTLAEQQALNVRPGLERGTYTWNASTGAFVTPCPGVDTNGTAGFSHPNGIVCTGQTTTATVNGNTMMFSGMTVSRVGP